MEPVLLKIQRQFSRDEAIALLQAELAKAKFKNGELLSELAEVRDENKQLKKQVALQQPKLTKDDLKEQRFIELQKGLTTAGKTAKRLREEVDLWRSKFFDLQNKQLNVKQNGTTN